jgi:hypothetical protein
LYREVFHKIGTKCVKRNWNTGETVKKISKFCLNFAMMHYDTLKPSFSNALRLSAVSLLLFAVTALAFASKGGGEKKKRRDFENSFTPINAASSFTLKKAPLYSGSIISFHPQTENRVTLNAMITYQRGNTTFILPYQYKVEVGPVTSNGGKSNLQFLGIKIQMPK